MPKPKNASKGKLYVVGAGLSALDCTARASDVIHTAQRCIVLTERCACADTLRKDGIAFETLDAIYESVEDFEEFCARATAFVLGRIAAGDVLCLAVPGSPEGMPLLTELRRAAEESGVEVQVIPGVGYADVALADLAGTPGFEELGRRCFASALPDMDWRRPLCIQEVDNVLLAGDVKLALLDVYPEECEVILARWNPQDRCMDYRRIFLYALDRQEKGAYGHDLSVLVPRQQFADLTRYGVDELMDIIRRLRAPGGCPWDREQTHLSLRSAVLEEAYEVAEAIDANDNDALCEELGDLLLQVLFHALIAEEQGAFDDRDVSSEVSRKMIHRHPHVFGTASVRDSAAVVRLWEDIKQEEKGQESIFATLDAVPHAFPALMRAAKLQKRAARVGFDWENVDGALEKVTEEAGEWLDEWRSEGEEDARMDRLEMEMGDWIFSVVNVARLAGIDPENALQRSSEKFIDRFRRMEERMLEKGKTLCPENLDAMNDFWEQSKKQI